MKLVLDACNEVAYTDDYLVEEVRYRVYRREDGEEPRTEVLIYPLDSA
jgi:Holliday junction resolvase RusA-like endonuclease